jgi:hypothetical protein
MMMLSLTLTLLLANNDIDDVNDVDDAHDINDVNDANDADADDANDEKKKIVDRRKKRVTS